MLLFHPVTKTKGVLSRITMEEIAEPQVMMINNNILSQEDRKSYLSFNLSSRRFRLGRGFPDYDYEANSFDSAIVLKSIFIGPSNVTRQKSSERIRQS